MRSQLLVPVIVAARDQGRVLFGALLDQYGGHGMRDEREGIVDQLHVVDESAGFEPARRCEQDLGFGVVDACS